MDGDRQESQTAAGTKLSREQKAGFMFVIGCGLVTLVLGGQYLWTHLASPFVITYTGPKFMTNEEELSAEVARQKTLDTDADTVSDYDELYIFKSSPYLADTDSDGTPDGQEITAGDDPTCAPDAACAFTNDEDVELSDGTTALEDQAQELEEKKAALDQAIQEINNLSTGEVRQVLLKAGMDKAEVDALSDQQVNELYQQTLKQIQQEQSVNELLNSEISPELSQ